MNGKQTYLISSGNVDRTAFVIGIPWFHRVLFRVERVLEIPAWRVLKSKYGHLAAWQRCPMGVVKLRASPHSGVGYALQIQLGT